MEQIYKKQSMNKIVITSINIFRLSKETMMRWGDDFFINIATSKSVDNELTTRMITEIKQVIRKYEDEINGKELKN